MRKLLLILALAAGFLPGCEGDSQPQPVAASRQVLAFTAAWCEPCRRNQPILADMERQGAPIVKVDIDANPTLATKHGIVSVPTYVVLENGREIERTQDIRRLLKLLRLGMFKDLERLEDNPERLEAAACYLRAFQGPVP